MFTGIITAKSKVIQQEELEDGIEVAFETPQGWEDIVVGESISVNGVCLTITSIKKDCWMAILMPETLSKTSFRYGLPKIVNLERAMPLTERLSGHIVQGHVDSVGKVIKVNNSGGYVISIEFPTENASLVINKGSVTIDGVSLTVTACEGNVLSVALIPHTLSTTTLVSLRENDLVNVEFDVIGKYVAKILRTQR